MKAATQIQLLQQGNHQAFRQLVDQYKDLLLNTCYRFVHHREDAEDLTQEVFIEVHRSIHHFRGDSSLKTWLYRIAVTKSLDYLRKQKKRKTQELSDEQLNRLEANHLTDHDNERLSIRLKALKEAITHLNDNQRTAFTLNKYEGLTALEIADIMNLKKSGVDALIHRAKAKIRKELEKIVREKSQKAQA
ncbi:MAG: RNA polymerase sigma factor [Bacteroidota bacterium]